LTNRIEATRDLVQRIIPRDLLELSRSFAPDAPHRMQQPVAMVRPLDVPVDLRAEKAARERMVGIAGDLDSAP
jgi:hypothetical protein